jgi:hypothetical protein
MAHPMIARRNDFTGKVSPRIPVPANRPYTSCDPFTERRIRMIVTWNTGNGLITEAAVRLIGGYYIDGLVSLADIRKMLPDGAYGRVVIWIAQARAAGASLRAKAARAKEKGIWER